MSAKPSLLWLDMTVSTHDPSPTELFQTAFEIQSFWGLASVDAQVARLRPAAICFDFDFPTREGLKMLQHTKKAQPSLPLIMLTVQHSEALAVWAFRSRVWDYLVKPIARGDAERCLGTLTEMLKQRDPATPPRQAAIPGSLIPEENRTDTQHSPLSLEPALHYVEQSFRAKVSSAEAAKLCGMSAFRFSRAFKETFGLTFQEYLLRFRIREACRLLRNPAAQVTDVAYLVGFNDVSYFGKIFRRYTNTAPSRFAEVAEAALDPDRLLDVLAAD